MLFSEVVFGQMFVWKKKFYVKRSDYYAEPIGSDLQWMFHGSELVDPIEPTEDDGPSEWFNAKQFRDFMGCPMGTRIIPIDDVSICQWKDDTTVISAIEVRSNNDFIVLTGDYLKTLKNIGITNDSGQGCVTLKREGKAIFTSIIVPNSIVAPRLSGQGYYGIVYSQDQNIEISAVGLAGALINIMVYK